MNMTFKTTFVAAAIAVAATSSTASAQISFQPAVSYFAGTQPDASAIGDLNGDGFRDLAVPTDAPDKMSLLFNSGTGTFSAPTNILLTNGTGPSTPVIGDLDGDGDMDIAVTLKNTNQVQLIVNNNGVFTPGAVFTVGLEPRNMKIADLDNDGDLDLVVSNRTGNSVSVLRNNGGLSFTVASYPAGLGPREVSVGDVTGDGLPDIAVAAHDSRQVVVLQNTGNAAFAPLTTLSPANEKPEGVAIARLDANGTFDIVATASVNNVEFAFVFLNTGAGVFGGGTPYSLGAGVVNTDSIVTGDFDLDGDQDFATSNQDTNNVSILANAGNGTFGPALVLSVGTQPNHITAGLLDANGSLDLVTANDGSANVSVLLNTNTGSTCASAPYCTGKVNSQGGVAAMGSTGTPSPAGNFVVTISGALPNTLGLLFYSPTGAASIPFQNGTLCVANPRIRVGIHQMVGGATAYPIAVTPAMAGTSRWFQFFYRDVNQPDGTGVGLSNALRVDFCQ